jgi:acyl-CoA reductase-like NAD-dependent aldehyde dehydrogenase
MEKFKMFIQNEWVDASDARTFMSYDPSKGVPIAQLPLADETDVDKAVHAARKAFQSGAWSDLDGDERAEIMLKAAAIMRKRAAELAWWEAMDSGKPIMETETIDIPYSIRAMEYFANISREIKGEVIPIPGKYAFDYVTYEPYGVVAAVTPWNFPLHLSTRAICPAIAAGNCVVAKTSSLAPVTTTLLGEIILEAGFPAGVVNIISGSGRLTGNALIRHPEVDMVSFTGSLDIGREIMKASSESKMMKKMILELGGKGPFIAEPDCNVDGAVNSVIVGFCLVAGQVCCASTRLFLHEDIYDAFLQRLAARVKSLRLGDIMDRDTQVGSLINQEQLERVDGYVREAIADGANLVCGGHQYATPPFDKGSYYLPTILDHVTNDMKCAREEIFGPVLVVMKYKNIDDAIAMANDSEYGLGATIWSENPRTLFWAAKKLNAGTVWMNTNVMSKMEAPYGGNKNSGIGREYGVTGIKEYMKIKNTILYTGKEYDDFYGFAKLHQNT